MTDELHTRLRTADDALNALEAATHTLNLAAKEAIDADTALRQAKATLEEWESALLLDATRAGVLGGKNAETREAQFREYRNQSEDWLGAVTVHHDATVSAARARLAAESAAARFTCAKEAVRLHTAIVGLIGRTL